MPLWPAPRMTTSYRLLIAFLVMLYRIALTRRYLPSHRRSNCINQNPVVDPFSYLSVLISIVLALGMTRVLAGVGEMLQARSHRKIYWVHAVWVVNVFIYQVVAWWNFYRWRSQQSWTFLLFVF